MAKQPSTTPLTIRLPRASYDAVLSQAEGGNTSAAEIVRLAVSDYLESRRDDDRHTQIMARLDAIDGRVKEAARWVVAQLAPADPVPTAAVSAAAHRPGPVAGGGR